MMQCPQCGEDNSDDTWTCSRCRMPFADPPPPPDLTHKYSRWESLTAKFMLVSLAWFVFFLILAPTGEPAFFYFVLFGIPGTLILWLCAPIAFILDLIRSLSGKRETKPSGGRALLLWIGLTISGAIICSHVIRLFIEIPTRSITARMRGDLRTFGIALDTYHSAHKSYPAWSLEHTRNINADLVEAKSKLAKIPAFATLSETRITLTTPIAYLSSHFSDPFTDVKGTPFAYWTDATKDTTATGYIMWSPGPDYVYDLTIDNIAQAYDPRSPNQPSAYLLGRTYDPSNGVNSEGDIWRIKQ